MTSWMYLEDISKDPVDVSLGKTKKSKPEFLYLVAFVSNGPGGCLSGVDLHLVGMSVWF